MNMDCDRPQLVEWCDLARVLPFAGEFPGSVQFGLPRVCPTENHSLNSTRQKPFGNRQCCNVDLRFVLAVNSVEMWWRMLSVKHPNHYAVKPAKFRHLSFVCG